MLSRRSLPWTCFVLSATALISINPLPQEDWALLGPIYLPPASGSLPALADAKARLKAEYDDAVATGDSQFGALDNQNTSFSVLVFSAESNETLFEYNYEAPGLNGSLTKGKLSADTDYRIGSCTKLLTVYAILHDLGDSFWLDPVTKYIPELKAAQSLASNPVLYTNWDEITIESLASQISGLGRDYLLGDLAQGGLQNPPVSTVIDSGYPPLPNATIPKCSFYDDDLPTCSRKEFLDGLIHHPPAFPSYKRAAYSNVAFALLGFVYEQITGKNLTHAYERIYQDELGMTSTTPNYPPKNADAIIPFGDEEAVWSYSIGVQWPAGDAYSTANDFKKLGLAILQHAQLSGELTRRWMRPRIATAQSYNMVGSPWEIYRLPILANNVTNESRIIDVYSKGGDIGLYSSWFGLDADHNIGFVVFAAGSAPSPQVQTLLGLAAATYIPAADEAAKDQASGQFTGHFRAKGCNSSLTLSVDGGPGVLVSDFISNGRVFLPSALNPFDDVRLYPTGLEYHDKDTLYRAYRAQLIASSTKSSKNLWYEYAEQWLLVDELIYNNLATDAFVVGFDKDGIVQTIRNDALRVTLYRA